MVGLSGAGRQRDSRASPEQLRYARVLDYGMKLGLIVLVAGLLAYVIGVVPAQVPLEELPRLWVLPVPDYLREAGMTGGWGWLAMLGKGDVLTLAGVALLASASLPCLLVLVPIFAGRRDWAYLSIAILQIGMLVLAASGVLTVGH